MINPFRRSKKKPAPKKPTTRTINDLRSQYAAIQREREIDLMRADREREILHRKQLEMLKSYNASPRQQQLLQQLQQRPMSQKGNGMPRVGNDPFGNYYQNQMARQMYGPQPVQPYRKTPPKKPMNPPVYAIGSKVTVRTGKTIWTVMRSEVINDNYRGYYHLYYLEDSLTGKQTREEEPELKEASGGNIPKAQVDFDSVIISDEKRAQILEALEQVNQMDLIFNVWGFGETVEKGRGVSMLFYGPPGTGKTLMGQALANKLGYTLKVISTADIESSAPGEAERNIRKHFAEAKSGKAILLFDECDSLIYSRAGTGPILSAQINELLSQIERFDGITIFTTNRLGTLDEAINRRLALKLEFAMPTPEERADIWKRMFPKQAPLDDKIDWGLLAEFEITGGYIKNAVLRAARMAATEKMPDADKKIMMKHLKKALKLEVESMMEFEAAKKEHDGQVGHVVRTRNGRKIVKKADMERSMG